MEIIAFYLPQFYPFKENDEWWGKGFTEWTNVGKAKPLFKGHNQPRIPADLGYYDLRLPIIREQQVNLAKDAGVTAFCYWHYWFGNGKRLMSEVFQEVLESGKPDFPFCLGWANHSWFAKDWNSDGTSINKLLIKQTYPGIEDQKMHFAFLCKAFSDKRYLKVDGKPILYIFAPQDIPDEYIYNLRKWTKEAGFPDLYLIANMAATNQHYTVYTKNQKYNAVSFQRLDPTIHMGTNFKDIVIRGLQRRWLNISSSVFNKPARLWNYKKYYKSFIGIEDYNEDVIPVLIPQWDHTPRSGVNGSLFINATPELFYMHCKDVFDVVKNKNNKLIFLKSWNEWGEGNMMEPDLTYGNGFIKALRKAIDELK